MAKERPFPRARAALAALGSSDEERAKALGVSVRTLKEYKAGRWPRNVMRLLCTPRIPEVLLEEIRANPSVCDEADTPAK